MRILLAGRDVLLLEALQSFLWDNGFEAEIAEDALECVTVMREFAPQALLVIDELLWGGADGVIAIMNDDRALAKTRVLFLSTDDTPAETTHWTHAPLGLNELPQKLRALQRTEALPDCRWRPPSHASLN